MYFSVATTAHLTSTTSTGDILKFDDVKLSVGISNLSEYKSTGKFICEGKGLYMISSSIRSNTNGAEYYIYLNIKQISLTKIGQNYPSSTTYHTGTVVLALQLLPSDSVWVQNPGYSIQGGLWCTLTIVKVN